MRRIFLMSLLTLMGGMTLHAQNLLSASSSVMRENATESPVAISWDQKSIDFQLVELGEEISHTFTLTNKSDQAIKIEGVKPSCGCTAAEYTTDWIEPGKTGYVTARLKAKNKGFFTKTVTVTYGPIGQKQILTLRGEVKSSK